MRTSDRLLSTAACLTALSLGCGSEESNGEQRACVPNASVSCAGPGNCSGFQVCKSDGSAYSACDCVGSGGAGGGSGASGSGGGTFTCPKGLPGPALVELQSPNGTRYCMDATEVTFAQYDEFLTAGVDPAKEADPCVGWPFAYNDPTFPDCLSGLNKIPDAPARCVDWCAARAYCKWAGKRLCGRIGGGPINGKNGDATDPNASQWFNACSAGGKQDFAYGNTEKTECTATINDIGAAGAPDVCQGSVPGLYGLSSNAAEWEDACEPGDCDFLSRPWSSSSPYCKDTLEQNNKHRFIGFRCCRDDALP